MGLGRETLDEMMVSEMVEDEIQQSLLAEKEWQVRNGEILKIKDMKTSHIQNCINLIVKSEMKWRGEFLHLLKAELQNRRR